MLGKRDVKQMTAWIKIALYANSVNSTIIEDGVVPTKYDSVISFIPRIPNAIPGQAYELDFEIPSDPDTINKLITSYENLPSGGKYVIILPKEYLWASNSYYSLRPLWEKMIKDNSLTEIIQMPCVMSINHHHDDFCMVIAEKGRKDSKTTMIDARFAAIKSDDKNFDEILDLSSLEYILENGGKERTTGLRKMAQVSTKDLNVNILIPQIYVIEKPLNEERPLPLSKFGTLATTRVRSLQIDLPEETPWVELSDLSHSFKGELDISALKKAGCPNNPKFVEGTEDYAFSKSGKFIDDFWAQTETKKGSRVYDYRRCTYLDGTKDAVLFRSSQHGIGMAIVRGKKRPMVVGLGIKVFVLKDTVDVLTLIATLRLPVVHRQILAYTEFGLEDHLDDILVPTDKRILYEEKQRLQNELLLRSSLEEELAAKKTEYINEIRMRKHDMRPHMTQLNSANNLMQYYVNNLDTTDENKQNLNRQIVRFGDALGHLSDIIEHLSDEEKFGEEEKLSIIDYFEKLASESRNNKNDISLFIDSGTIVRYLNTKLPKPFDRQDTFVKAKNKEYLKRELAFIKHWTYIMISSLDFDRLTLNILENARKHGFTDSKRTDYMIWINLSVDEKRDMYIIDFLNNGTPLPNGMTKERYGMKGEKAGLTGGTGSGGYIVKSIVTHYGGDFDLVCVRSNTIVRIYLPIAKIWEQDMKSFG